MTDIQMLVGVSIYLIFAIIILWKSNLMMIGKKNVTVFLPFLLVGTALCFRAAFIFYGLLDTLSDLILEYASAIAILWILVNTMGGENVSDN